MTTVLLLPSPLLGTAPTWQPVAGQLTARGIRVRTAEVPTSAVSSRAVMTRFVAQARAHRPDALVPHSNAGLFAPAVAATCDARATVFVDAALPAAAGSTRLAPADLRAALAGLAVDGVLPPWTRWWPAEELAGLFPSEEWRRRIEAGQSRMPLDYFDATVDAPADWTLRPCAYLGFGATYRDELAAATSYGWPTRVLEGRHLHQLHDPVVVTETIVQLLGELGVVA